MASIANITVKKADGTTNVIYVAAVPSSGDKSPAIWTQDAYSGIQGNRPRLEISTQDNGAGNSRQLRFKLTYPVVYTDTVTGLEKQVAYVEINGTSIMPKVLTTTQWKEAFAQLGNLLHDPLIIGAAESGYAPT